MKLPPDYHNHTIWSNHAVGTMEQYVQHALEIGLSEMAFTPHLPIRTPSKMKLTLAPEEMLLFDAEIKRLQDAYASRIIIRYGGEADYVPGTEKDAEKLLKQYPFDFLITSVHYIGDWGFDTPEYADEFERRDLETVYAEYVRLLRAAIGTGLFDIVGHFDLPKKFGHRLDPEPLDLYGEVLDLVAAAGMCIELNTAGRDKPVKEFYPSESVLRLALERGIGVTTGSDSHAPAEVGRYFEEARDLLCRLGFREVMRFEARKRLALPLCH